MTKLVVLDCDGTLVDSQNEIYTALAYAFTKAGLEVPPRSVALSVVGLSLPEAFAMLAPAHDGKTRAELSRLYKAAFVELKRDPGASEPLFPGIQAAIEAFGARDDVVLGIATGKSRRGVDRLFEREGWAHRFVTVQTADDHPSKPHPAMLLAAMAEAGVEPARAVMVGDTTYDMAMACAAGTGALGVGWGYHPVEELHEAGAHAVIDDGDKLIGAIDDFFAKRERAA